MTEMTKMIEMVELTSEELDAIAAGDNNSHNNGVVVVSTGDVQAQVLVNQSTLS
jgi:hypothetical protein